MLYLKIKTHKKINKKKAHTRRYRLTRNQIIPLRMGICKGDNQMDLFIYLGIIDELKANGEDLYKYTLKDIKKIYNSYIR